MALPSAVWSLTAADVTRSDLIKFWLACPDDQLEFLWNSNFGVVTSSLVKSLDSNTSFSPNEVSLRNEIGVFFNTNGLNHPLSAKLMVVNFLLSPPSLLTINNVNSFFPSWLSNAYLDIYEANLNNPTGQISTSAANESVQPSSSDSMGLPTPIIGPFPQSLEALSSDRVHLNRLLGLSNLYYIDPEDSEIANELLEVRTSFAKIINSADPASLQHIWYTELGDRYWALVRSGIQKESLNDSDQAIKNGCVQVLNPSEGGGFSHPRSLNALLVSMMYFLPGTMKVSNPQQNIPSWLIKPYEQIFNIESSS